MSGSLAAARGAAGRPASPASAPASPAHRPSSEKRRKICNNDDLQSPLRYPGGKRQLVPFLVDAVKLNGLAPLELFIEPFAGGGAASLHLLVSGAAEKVVLAERDCTSAVTANPCSC